MGSKEPDTAEQLPLCTFVDVDIDKDTDIYIYIYRERERERLFLRDWFTRLWRLASQKSVVWVSRLETNVRIQPMFQLKSETKAVCWQNSLSLRRGQSFGLVRLSADWMRPTKIMEGNLLYSKFTSLKVSLIQNTHRNIWNNIWPTIWHCGVAK